MTFEEWEGSVSGVLRRQPIWRVTAYRKSLYLAACAAEDVVPILRDIRFTKDIPQLVEAVGSIGSNIWEGYGRRSRPDRIKFYEYAYSSVGESTHWYAVVSAVLDDELFDRRAEQFAEVAKLLLTMIGNERRGGGWNDSRRKPPHG